GASVREGDVVGTVDPSGVPDLPVPYVHLGVRETADPQGYLDPQLFLPASSPSPVPPPGSDGGPAPPPPAPVAAPPPPEAQTEPAEAQAVDARGGGAVGTHGSRE